MDPATLHSLQTIPSTYELKRTTYFSKIDQLKDRYKQYEPFYHKHVTRVENLYKEYSILENQSGNKNRLEKLRQELGEYKVNFYHYFESKKILLAMQEEQVWLKTQSKKINFILMPLFRPYHWEDDVGGTEELNTFLPWWQLSRVNHKDLSSSILFGIRASLIVGLLATLLQLLIGIPVGALAGYYGKKIDMIVSRLLEIWEGIPTFFILLLF